MVLFGCWMRHRPCGERGEWRMWSLTLPFTLGEGSVVACVHVLQVVRDVDIVWQWKRNTCLLAKTPETVRVHGWNTLTAKEETKVWVEMKRVREVEIARSTQECLSSKKQLWCVTKVMPRHVTPLVLWSGTYVQSVSLEHLWSGSRKRELLVLANNIFSASEGMSDGCRGQTGAIVTWVGWIGVQRWTSQEGTPQMCTGLYWPHEM